MIRPTLIVEARRGEKSLLVFLGPLITVENFVGSIQLTWN